MRGFYAAVPDRDSLACCTFYYILESPGKPKLFHSWQDFLEELNKMSLTATQRDMIRFSRPVEGDKWRLEPITRNEAQLF